MNELGQLMQAPSVDPNTVIIIMAWYILNCMVQALPDPEETSGMFYRFVFRFAHALAANINVVRKKLPLRVRPPSS